MKTQEVLRVFKELCERPDSNAALNSTQLLALKEITDLLSRAPNFDLVEARIMKQSDDLAVSLFGLVALSKYSKQQWIKIIEEFSLPIELHPRASTRDVVGKVLGYLEAHPESLRLHRQKRIGSSSEPPNTLEDTLTKLINFK
jgi:hypothetical protein